AFPLYRWGIVYREGRLLSLLNELDPGFLSDSLRFRRIDEQRYQVVKSTYLEGHYLYRGDLIKIESIAPEELLRAGQLAAHFLPATDRSVAFYHLDSIIVKRFVHEKLETVCRQFE
ncbi:MAG: hypothetical protein R3350_05675, partial [Saprospiraceae bacterium]|nr:hypothetical protein [Saprospiraceae bacterium]